MRHGVDIREWWRWAFLDGPGDVTSRRVWNLLLYLPDDSELKKATREGDWTCDQYVMARIANEVMLSRADYAAAHSAQMTPHLLLSPAQQEAEDAERLADAQVKELLRAQLHGEFVPPPQPGRSFDAEIDPKREALRKAGGERP